MPAFVCQEDYHAVTVLSYYAKTSKENFVALSRHGGPRDYFVIKLDVQKMVLIM